VLLHFHLRHPNRNLALNNKDRKNDDKDEAEQVCVHDLYQISLDYRRLAGKVKEKRFRIGNVFDKLARQPLSNLETRVRTQHTQHQGVLIQVAERLLNRDILDGANKINIKQVFPRFSCQWT
jgi:hypothetical protein